MTVVSLSGVPLENTSTHIQHPHLLPAEVDLVFLLTLLFTVKTAPIKTMFSIQLPVRDDK